MVKLNIDYLKQTNYREYVNKLTELERLDLNDKEIEDIDVNLFESISNLKELYLSNNKLKSIDSNVFKHLTKLERLDLDNNAIDMIEEKLFDTLSNLKVLYLNYNKLKSIDSNVFKQLTELEELSLGYNEIEKIDVRLFERLSNLKMLDLGNNELKTIDFNAFKNLDKLERLSLEFNAIDEIDVKSLIKVKLLFLTNNNIKSLSEDFFSYFPDLCLISLCFNNFSQITINLEKHNQNAIFIDLSSNLIEDFPNISMGDSNINNIFIYVDLRFNKIKAITNKNLENIKGKKIKYQISNNPLNKINLIGLDSEIFNFEKPVYDHITNINFKNNDIENPIFRNFEDWLNIPKFSILTGKNGIGKSSVLNYIYQTAAGMLMSIEHLFKYRDDLSVNKENMQHFISKYEKFFDLLPIDIDKKLLNSESKLKINKLYLPIIYRMHDTIRTTPDIYLREILKIYFFYPQIGLNRFNKNLIEIFYLVHNQTNDIFDILVLRNFGNKLELLNEHLKNHGFKYKIDKVGLIEFVDEKTGNRVRSKQMSPGEQLKVLFYIWEFTLSRFSLPFTPVLLLDEPDAHLHPKAVHEFIEILEKLSEAGAQIIMTTHNPTTVSLAKQENLFYMKENDNGTITIHQARSKADAIYELTENLVAVNIPFLTILVEGNDNNDNRFYELVRQKLVDLGNSYECQFIFKGFGGCEEIIGCLIFELEDDEPALNPIKEDINKKIKDVNKSKPIIDQTIKLITGQKKLSLDHFGIIDNDNHLEICSNNTNEIKKYYSRRDKHVYNLLRHSLESYVLDPISLYFYLKHLNSSNNQDFQIDREENSPFKILNDKVDSIKVKIKNKKEIEEIKIGEIKDPIKNKKLNDIKSIDEFINWEIDHDNKVEILQTIVNEMGKLIIDYLTEFVCFNPRIFYDKEISNLTPLLRFIEINLTKKNKDKDFFLLNWIDSYIKGTNQNFNQKYKSKQKIIKKDDSKTSQKENKEEKILELIKDIEEKYLKGENIKFKEKKFSEIYKSLIKVMKEFIRIHDLKESEYKEDIKDIDKLLDEKIYYNEINKHTGIKDIDISILQDFSERNDNDLLNDTVTKQQLKNYINFKLELDKYLVELIKKDLEETIECHFVNKINKDIKINYPKVFYCYRGHNFEETVCKMFFVKYPFKLNNENEGIYYLVKEIIKKDGLFEKCGYLIPNELKEIFDQINTITKDLLEKEQLKKLKREQENINNIEIIKNINLIENIIFSTLNQLNENLGHRNAIKKYILETIEKIEREQENTNK